MRQMNRLTLVVPGLIWPDLQTPHPAEAVPHPALARLLGRGQWRIGAAIPYEQQLSRLLGTGDGEILPSCAVLRGMGEEHAANGTETHWLCADPVHLGFMGGQVLLDEFAEGEIDAHEAATLIDTLNADFASLGHFSAATPTRWYLRRKDCDNARFAPLHDVVCRPIQHFLPDGDEANARHWRQYMNEIQVTLHNHPINATREAAGRRPVNSLWFWGEARCEGGDAPACATPRVVQAREPIARGLARRAGLEAGAPDATAALRGGASTLVVLDALASPVRHFDPLAWQSALGALENEWFAPAARALDEGRIGYFALHAPCEQIAFSLTVGSAARWYFWRKPMGLDALQPRLPQA
jgi:hypothetical protein